MQPPVIAAQPAIKKDNLFGICHALGEELGFNPLWLRLTLAVALLWNPVLVLAAYFYAGLVMLIARWLLPRRRRVATGSHAAATAEAVADNAALPELAQAA